MGIILLGGPQDGKVTTLSRSGVVCLEFAGEKAPHRYRKTDERNADGLIIFQYEYPET